MKYKIRVINLLESLRRQDMDLGMAYHARFCTTSRKIVNIRLFFLQAPLFEKKVFSLRHNYKSVTNMKKEEMERLTNMIAQKTADIVMERLNGSSTVKVDEDEYVDSKEAARILDVTPNYLRSMKHKFPHVKIGSHNQGRVLFKKSELLKNYTNQ